MFIAERKLGNSYRKAVVYKFLGKSRRTLNVPGSNPGFTNSEIQSGHFKFALKKTLGGSCMKNELRDICVRLSGFLDQAKGFQVLKAEFKDGRWYLEVERIDEEATDESNE